MSNIYKRSRQRYGQRPAVDSSDFDGLAENFREWLNGAYAESYALKVSEYCKSFKSCNDCVFYNGTCRLNNFPYNWDVGDYLNT